MEDGTASAETIAGYFEQVLAATHELIACCKPQSAFFEALGPPGLEALSRIVDRARELGVPVILDAKRGDIDSTAQAYADAYLGGGWLSADALTINPYLGMDSLEPFVAAAEGSGRGVFVLVKTSNPGSADLQDVRLANGDPLYLHVAKLLTERAASLPRDERGYGPVGAVVGATHAQHLSELRSLMPTSVLLVPGFGAQGGTAQGAASAFDEDGFGAVVSASRSLTYPKGAVGDDAKAAVAASRAAVVAMRDSLNRSILER